MGKLVDLENRRFDRLLVIKRSGVASNGGVMWHCKCDCGNEVDVLGRSLLIGATKSCGCKHRGNLINKRFEKLLVIKELGKTKNGNILWLCKCDCGNITTKTTNALIKGRAKSCGCVKPIIKPKKYKVGDTIGCYTLIEYLGKSKWKCRCSCGNEVVKSSSKLGRYKNSVCRCNKANREKHGMYRTRFYNTYKNINSRCNKKYNTYYHNYGARGIKCLWSTFEEFRDDMYQSYLEHCEEFGEDQTTLDRIDNNGNYCKENCRWATRKEQSCNTRKTILYKGKCLKQWCLELGLNYKTINSRIRVCGWDIEKAITTPIEKRGC